MSDFKVETRVRRVEPAPPRISGHRSGGRFEPPREGARFEDAHLENVDFSGLRIALFTAVGSTFERCDFSRSVIQGSLSGWPRSVYRDCRFDRADLHNAGPDSGRFERCSFERAKLDHWRSWSADFIECRFAGRLRDVEFRGVAPFLPPKGPVPENIRPFVTSEPSPNDFRGNDFRNTDLDIVEFIKIDLEAQLWPDNPDLVRLDVRPETIDMAERAAEQLAPSERARAQWMLGWLRGRYAGQAEVLFRRRENSMFTLYMELLSRAQGTRH